MRTIYARNDILPYLENFDTKDSLTVGLILGQTQNGKDYVIHLARTLIPPPLKLEKITDLNSLVLADHAKQATRMLPGGMRVIGIFFVSENDLLSSSTLSSEVKTALKKLQKVLSTEYSNNDNGNYEQIFLNYCSKSASIKVKSVDSVTWSVKPAELKFNEDDFVWIKFECKYGIDRTCYLNEKSEIDLKEQLDIILEDEGKKLRSSVFLFDGEYKDGNDSLDSSWKKKKNWRSSGRIVAKENADNIVLPVTILQNIGESDSPDIVVKKSNNQIRVIGQIASAVWLHPSMTYEQAKNSIIEDVLRSFSTRFEMHFDSLIEEEHTEDLNSIHEPPRRVLINLSDSKVAVSDYLFPGEGAEEAKNSVEEILDIKLKGLPNEINDIEGSIDIKKCRSINKMVEGKIAKEETEHSHMLFIIGSIFALLVLIVSIIMHFVIKFDNE